MRAGNLRHRITFQIRSDGQDGYGGQEDIWTDYRSTWASIEPLNGRELIAAQAVQNETRFTIGCRYIAGILPSMRILFGTRIFNILDMSNIDERNRELQFSCSEGLANG
jgi:SPP1 family predicted phage head-tail adaptor